MTKILKNRNNPPMPAIHGPRGLVFTDLDKAEAFADTLELQFRANHTNFRHTNAIHREVRSILTENSNEFETKYHIEKNHKP
ncbi:hypothetical protein RN001_000204 [Aquatica leii]|uniref:Uncharacterized protein n=1 Tax=Aquatica leii TaxID=1421715 RepID=A0AAN7SQH1_9COLE|nr:hypothetical protein RN001_000204 [Aquatica leii]